jgi:hypothetical protein
MLIKVKDSEGNIFATDLNDKRTILEIHFCTSYTQFKVQEEYLAEDGSTRYREKDIIVPTEKNDLESAIDFMAADPSEIGEIVTCEF